MASGDSGAEGFGQAFASLIQIIFSLTFPLVLLTLCGVSYLLTYFLHAPEFSLWSSLAQYVLGYAWTNIWVAIGVGVFALAAIPLAWVAFREQEVKVSSTILSYVLAALFIGFTFWLRTVWPYAESRWQIIAYGILMFIGWGGVIEAGLGTLGIVSHVRRNRPPPAVPPPQDPHGARTERPSDNDPETI